MLDSNKVDWAFSTLTSKMVLARSTPRILISSSFKISLAMAISFAL